MRYSIHVREVTTPLPEFSLPLVAQDCIEWARSQPPAFLQELLEDVTLQILYDLAQRSVARGRGARILWHGEVKNLADYHQEVQRKILESRAWKELILPARGGQPGVHKGLLDMNAFDFKLAIANREKLAKSILAPVDTWRRIADDLGDQTVRAKFQTEEAFAEYLLAIQGVDKPTS